MITFSWLNAKSSGPLNLCVEASKRVEIMVKILCRHVNGSVELECKPGLLSSLPRYNGWTYLKDVNDGIIFRF